MAEINNPKSANEAHLMNALGGNFETGTPKSRIEALLAQLVAAIKDGGSAKGVKYQTTAPTSANTEGDLKFVVLNDDPITKYSGYIYIITGGTE